MAGAARRALRSLARFALRPEYREERLHDWSRRRRGEPPLPPERVQRILVVCHGNICRSPFAEALLRTHCPDRQVRSAGFAAGDGICADPSAIEVAREWRIDLTPHRAHLLRSSDLDWAQLVLVMTVQQAGEVPHRGPAGISERVRLLGDYLAEPPFAIDDPYGRPANVFRACFERIDAATAQLTQRLRAGEE